MVKPKLSRTPDVNYQIDAVSTGENTDSVRGQHVSGVIRAVKDGSAAVIACGPRYTAVPIRIGHRWFNFPRGDFIVDGIGKIHINSPLSSVRVISSDVILISFDTSPSGQYPGAYLALCIEDLPQDSESTLEVANHLSLFYIEDVIIRDSSETDMAYDGRVRHFRNLVQRWKNFADRIFMETGIGLHRFPIRTVLMFGAFWGWLINTGQTEAQKELLNILKERDQDFLSVFIAGFEICEFNPEDGLLILRLLSKRNNEQSMQILRYYNFLCGQIVVDEGLDHTLNHHEGDLTQQYVVSKKAVRRLIIEASLLGDNEQFDAFLLHTNRFLEDQIFMGARLSHLLKVASDERMKPEEIASIDECGLVEVIALRGGHKVRLLTREAMRDPGNYLTDDFSVNDYEMIVDNLEIYDDTNPVWKEILIDNIPKDLEDPETLFVVVRMKDVNLTTDVHTVGIIKVRPEPAGQKRVFYIGTLYVEEYLQQYHVADYLQGQAERLIEDNFGCDEAYIYWGAVCTRNSAMQRHIERANGIVTAIIKDSDEERESDNLYKVEFGHETNFISKISNRSDLKFLIDEGCQLMEFDQGTSVAFRKYDTSLDSEDDYVGELSEFFSSGYVVTRYFYGFRNNAPDYRETYIVLEKPVEPIISTCFDSDD